MRNQIRIHYESTVFHKSATTDLIPALTTFLLGICLAVLPTLLNLLPSIEKASVPSSRVSDNLFSILVYVAVLTVYFALILSNSHPTNETHGPTSRTELFSASLLVATILPAAVRTDLIRSTVVLLVVTSYMLLVSISDSYSLRFRSRVSLKRFLYVSVGLVAIIYAAANYFLPIIGSYFRPEEEVGVLTDASSHYAVTVIPGFDLICCQVTGEMEPTGYGLGMSLLSAVLLTLRQMWSPFESGEALKFVTSTSQVLILVLSYMLFRMIHKGTAVLISILLVITTPTFSFAKLDAPNLTGLRFIPFVLFLIALKLIGELRGASCRVVLLAASSSMMMLLSFEIGLVTLVVSLGYAIIRSNENTLASAELPLRLFLFVSTFAVCFVALNLLVSSLLGRSYFLQSMFAASDSAVGYGGLVIRWHPEALLFFSIATIELSRNWQTHRAGRAESIDYFRLAVSASMLGWLVYYFYRQNSHNLTFQWVLLLVLVSANSRSTESDSSRLSPRKLAIVSLLCWSIFGTASGSIQAISRHEFCRYKPPTPIVAQKCLNQAAHEQVSDYLQTLSSIENKSEYLVFSFLPSEVRILGFNDRAPFYDLKLEVLNEQTELEIVKWIEQNRPPFVLSHNPTSAWSLDQPELNQKVQRIVSKIKGYEILNVTDETITLAALN